VCVGVFFFLGGGSYLAQFFLEREMSRTEVVEKIKTHVSCVFFFF